jgi:SAM-dependent methyltransferase
MNQITELTTKEELLDEYKNYPSTMSDLDEKPFYEHRIAPIFYEVPLGSKVLDIGANDGAFIKMLKEKRECKVWGVDVSDVAIQEAKKNGVDVIKADAHKLPFKDKAFDVVIIMEVLSHVHNPEEVLKEARRVLKKNGILLGSTPHTNLQRYAWEDARKIHQYYDEKELIKVMGDSFERCWLKVLTGGQFAVSMAHSFLAEEPVEMLFKCGRDNTLNWDAALQDRSILRCWMGFTQAPGTVYYRMSGYADKMQKLGAQVHYNPYNELERDSPGEWGTKIFYLANEKRFTNMHIVNQLESLLKAADMSIFQLTSNRSVLLLLTTARKGVIKKPMWTELDDWFFDLPSYNIASSPYQPNSELESIAYDQMKLSDGFICSTDYLKEKILTLFPNKPVHVIKNSLDFDIWDKVEKVTTDHDKNPDLIRIGYTGCDNHSGDMEIVKKPLLALLEEFPNLEVMALPRNYVSFEGINHPRILEWNSWVGMSQYPQVVSTWEMDIGIAPLRDNELNRCKSNLRWLEYSALKIPTVTSRITPFQNSIENNKTGLVVGNSAKEWYEALRSLILDKGKRASIGQRAYEKVRKDYDMDNVAKTYLSVLKGIKDEFITASTRMRKAS